jgi:hypothetical protein
VHSARRIARGLGIQNVQIVGAPTVGAHAAHTQIIDHVLRPLHDLHAAGRTG